MGTMTYETAMAWMRLNRLELKQAAERGHPAAHRAMVAYMAAREKWSPIHSLEFERLARTFCDALNDFVVEELNKSGRAELRGKYGYKQADDIPFTPPDGYAWDAVCDCGHTRRQHTSQFALCRECGCVGFDLAPSQSDAATEVCKYCNGTGEYLNDPLGCICGKRRQSDATGERNG